MGISLPYWDLLIFDDPLLHKWDFIFGNDIITLYWWKKHFLKWHFFFKFLIYTLSYLIDITSDCKRPQLLVTDTFTIKVLLTRRQIAEFPTVFPKSSVFGPYCYFVRLIILCKYAEWKYWLCIQKLIVEYPLSIWHSLIGHEPTHWNFLMFMIKLCSFSDWFLYAFEEEFSPIVIIFRHGSINNVMLSHLHCHF